MLKYEVLDGYITTDQAAAKVGVSGCRVKIIAEDYNIEIKQIRRVNFYNEKQFDVAMPAIRNRPGAGRAKSSNNPEDSIDPRDHDPIMHIFKDHPYEKK